MQVIRSSEVLTEQACCSQLLKTDIVESVQTETGSCFIHAHFFGCQLMVLRLLIVIRLLFA